MSYELQPSYLDTDERGYEIVRPCPSGLEPEMYSVYFRFTDQCAHWIADFLNYDDAVKFMEMKKS